jgi:asparaginyl-tRNA synthetase
MIHLRTRTNTIAALTRIRNALAFATHKFFQESGFLYVHTPLITASDCEGAGEMFQVTTLLSQVEELAKQPVPTEEEIAAAEAEVAEVGELVRTLKEKKEKKKVKVSLDSGKQLALKLSCPRDFAPILRLQCFDPSSLRSSISTS